MSSGHCKTEIVNAVDAKRAKLLHAARRDAREYVAALVTAVEARDPSATAHSETVATYAEAIGRRMGLGKSMIQSLRSAGLLHDVGKLAVPEAILAKPGPLTTEEFETIKRHPRTALDILGHLGFLTAEKPMILHHHEWYDGSGYPAGLAANRIPIGARILAVADALDTMLSPRTYKESFTLDRVRAELRAGAARQFDPAVIDTTLRWLEETPSGAPTPARSPNPSIRFRGRQAMRRPDPTIPGQSPSSKPCTSQT